MRLRVFLGTWLLVTATVMQFGARTAFAQERPTGLIFTDPDKYELVPLRLALGAAPGSKPLPSSVDLSASFPASGDQGKLKSCVGWAVAYALKTHQEYVERSWSLQNDSHMFSPSYVYNQICGGADNGATFEAALVILKQQGVAPLSVFPYQQNVSVLPDAQTKGVARPFIIRDYARSEMRRDSIKTHLHQRLPVLIGAMVDRNFMSFPGRRVFQSFSGSGDGHAMVVIGYDDYRSAGAFQVINSWGTTWGDNGYGWIDYATFERMVHEAWTVTDDLGGQPPKIPAMAPPTQIPLMRFRFVNVKIVPGAGGGTLEVSVNGDIQGCERRDIEMVTRFYEASGPSQSIVGPPLLQPNKRDTVEIRSGVKRIEGQVFPLTSMPMSTPLSQLSSLRTETSVPVRFAYIISTYIDETLVSQSRPRFYDFRW